MNSIVTDLFPTSVITLDGSEHITQSDVDQMISSINNTEVNLFADSYPNVFQKLQSSFHEACNIYLMEVEDFIHDAQAISITGSRAIGSVIDSTHDSNIEWHNLSPALLCGIFYLKLVDCTSDGGTILNDMRHHAAASSTPSAIHPHERSWLIFPANMPHQDQIPSGTGIKYIIKAECFVQRK